MLGVFECTVYTITQPSPTSTIFPFFTPSKIQFYVRSTCCHTEAALKQSHIYRESWGEALEKPTNLDSQSGDGRPEVDFYSLGGWSGVEAHPSEGGQMHAYACQSPG